MSKKNPSYRNSFADKFTRWVKGDYDPIAGQMEMNAPDKEVFGDERIRYVHLRIVKSNNYSERMFEEGLAKNVRRFTGLYKVFGAIVAIFIACLLLWTVSYLPKFGDPNAPENNEVATRYIEQGLSETGAVNIVTGMILDYRAFDTFGESCVLFVASCCVLILLRVDKDEDPESRAIEDMNDRHYEPRNDTILQKVANFLVPLIIIFGIYVVLNGHISPGGGFSGGAIIGSGLILYLTAYGFEKTQRFMNEKVVKALTVGALTFYCFAKSYSFYTGANHLHSIITPGTPGNILSAGLIVYLNICVGIVVACTMYSFYTLFVKVNLIWAHLYQLRRNRSGSSFCYWHGNLVFQLNHSQENYQTRYHGFCCLPFPLAAKGYIEGRTAPIVVDGILDASHYINPFRLVIWYLQELLYLSVSVR